VPERRGGADIKTAKPMKVTGARGGKGGGRRKYYSWKRQVSEEKKKLTSAERAKKKKSKSGPIGKRIGSGTTRSRVRSVAPCLRKQGHNPQKD